MNLSVFENWSENERTALPLVFISVFFFFTGILVLSYTWLTLSILVALGGLLVLFSKNKEKP